MDTQDIFKRNLEYHQKEKAAQAADRALDAYEAEMISGINAHRAVRAAQAISREELIAERVAADKAAREDMEREYKASEAIKRYILVCLAILCFAAFSPFPVWAAATFCLGGGVFPASYIFRLYYPIDENESED
jgi:hypothetical protein